MKRFRSHPRTGRGGYSLVELITVLAIIVIMVGLSGIAVTSMTRGLNIGSAGNTVAATLENAREYAAANNTDVEVRLYQYQPSGSSINGYFAMQIFAKNVNSMSTLLASNGTSANQATNNAATAFTALGPVVSLPAGTVISNITGDSTLIDNALSSTSRTGVVAPPLPGVGTNYTYKYFTMLANGSTDLSNSIYDLTVVKLSDLQNDLNSPPGPTPADYSLVIIDPVSGHSTIHRP